MLFFKCLNKIFFLPEEKKKIFTDLKKTLKTTRYDFNAFRNPDTVY